MLAADREVTRLGESVFRSGKLSPEALDGLERVLTRMAESYRQWDVSGIRAVATSAVRDAANQAEFISRASAALGTQVEIISGREEARLIHQGVMSLWPQNGKRVLIVDIGGGSAEIIGSESGKLLDAYSKPLGAVRLQDAFLREDPPSERALHQLAEFVDQKLDLTVARMGTEWDRVITTSATAAAVVCAVNEVPRSRREEADRLKASTSQIRQLFKKVSGMGIEGRRRFAGIGPRRAEIIVAGMGTLLRILERFEVRQIYYCSAGVRDGIIADLAARGVGEQMARLGREQRAEVERVAARFGIVMKDAREVASFAQELFVRLRPLHQLPLPLGRLLEAACYLSNTGHLINDAAHHKHAFYIVSNLDFSGFTNRERAMIAVLCRYHRKSMPKPEHAEFTALSPDERRILLQLVPILRLADNLNRSHDPDVELVDCRVEAPHVKVKLRSPRELDLTEWAASRVSEAFQQVYGHDVQIERAR